jgi:SpoIID/LytB domain protein
VTLVKGSPTPAERKQVTRLPHQHRAICLVTGIAALAAGLTPALARSASAAQVSVVPSGRVFHVIGHGWGHGHGMSQDGAEGAAAVDHLSASQIVSFYYPHTAAGSVVDPAMRVLLSSTASNYVYVGKPAGSSAVLTIRDLASGYTADLPANATEWRFTSGTSAVFIAELVSGTWQAWGPPGHTSFAGPLNVTAKSSTAAAPMRVIYPTGYERDYRGYLQLVHPAANNIDVLDVVDMESYLRGVVPRESPSSWPAAALQAQAIAARSYAEYEREHAGSRDYDICDSTSCQVYGGTTEVTSGGSVIPLEAASSDAAVKATANQIRTYGGNAIFAQFSADDGGWTTDGGQPYLIAQRDPYDALGGSSNYAWSAHLPASALEHAYPSIGTLMAVRVTQRDGNGDWGGRVLQAVLEGSKASVTVSGSAIASAYSWPTHSDGLRGSWWQILLAPPADFTGDGRSDVSMWRPSTATWYIAPRTSVPFGQKGDLPVPGDYNGDGRIDRAVFRPSTGHWYVDGISGSTSWGLPGDIPVPADYNGDGKADVAVYRPSEHKWYIRGITSGEVWGVTGDIPVPGDYNGDGVADIAIWRPSNGRWYVDRPGAVGVTWGMRGDIPVPADYRGRGQTEYAVWRPSTGRWYVDDGRNSYHFGQSGDVPVPGDYNGDGIEEAALFRPSTLTWYRSGQTSVHYGLSSDEPLPLPYAIYHSR